MVYVGQNFFRPYYPALMVLNSLLYKILLVCCTIQPLENGLVLFLVFFSRESSMKYYWGQLNQHFNSQNKLVDSENTQFSVA